MHSHARNSAHALDTVKTQGLATQHIGLSILQIIGLVLQHLIQVFLLRNLYRANNQSRNNGKV